MTTMDSDSESQDSDDGRRFRFEATRKDNARAAPKMKTESSRSMTSKHETHYENTEERDARDRSKRESGRKDYRTSKDRDTENKDVRHAAKYMKHIYESRSSKYEDSHRDTSALLPKHKTKNSKHHRDQDRSEHRKHRSQERSHNSRNEEDKSTSSIDKHKNKSHDKYKHHSHERSRDRSYQSYRSKPSDHGRSRGEYERHGSYKKTIKDEDGQYFKEYSSPKSAEQGRNREPSSRRDLSADSQEYKNFDLSEFDVLSETDENLSDDSSHRKSKGKKRNSNDKYESLVKKQTTENEEHIQEYQKVNAKENDPLCGSSNNNPSTISDSLLGTSSSITSVMTEDLMNDVSKRYKRRSEEQDSNFNSKEESLNSMDDTSLHLDYHDPLAEMLRSEDEEMTRDGGTDSLYGPTVPSPPMSSSIDACNREKSSDQETESVSQRETFIGPCLPKFKDDTPVAEDDENFASEDSASDATALFGPALPPHLMQEKCSSVTREKIIGPALPNTITPYDDGIENEERSMESEDDESEAIGPLPIDHPALKSNYVYKQLEQRAQKLKDNRKDEGRISNQREEWMTELPSAQSSHLGLVARKFRVRDGPDMSDRSCWTDTPAKKAEKAEKQKEKHLYNFDLRNKEVTAESCDADSGKHRKREKSLLELHQGKLRKKKKKEEKEAKITGQSVRRPFDRDIDLKANQFDQAQKNIFLRKAQLLDEKFSRGKM